MRVYLNGSIVELARACISPLDRGFLMGDGVYEGLRAFGGRVVAPRAHAERLARGLDAIRLAWDASALGGVCEALLEATGLRDAFIYVQVTRGAPGPGEPVRARTPSPGMMPTVFAYAAAAPGLDAYEEPPVKRVVTHADPRWSLGQVKSTSLLGSVLGAIAAREAGADDAIFVRASGATWPRAVGGSSGDRLPDDALVAESTSANLVLLTPGGELVTPDLETVPILAGVTRRLLLEADGWIVERPVTLGELRRAAEVMLVGTMTMVTAIVEVDGQPVGGAVPGPRTRALLAGLVEAIRRGSLE